MFTFLFTFFNYSFRNFVFQDKIREIASRFLMDASMWVELFSLFYLMW